MTVKVENIPQIIQGYLSANEKTRALGPNKINALENNLTNIATVGYQGKNRTNYSEAIDLIDAVKEEVSKPPSRDKMSLKQETTKGMVTDGGISMGTARQLIGHVISMLGEAHFKIGDITTYQELLAAKYRKPLQNEPTTAPTKRKRTTRRGS